MDEIDAFKLKALESMSQPLDALTAQNRQGPVYLDRAKARDAGCRGEPGLSSLPK